MFGQGVTCAILAIIIRLWPCHSFHYGNAHNKLCAIFMPIGTNYAFGFLHCVWLDIIIAFKLYDVIIQFQDPHLGYQINICIQCYIHNFIHIFGLQI